MANWDDIFSSDQLYDAFSHAIATAIRKLPAEQGGGKGKVGRPTDTFQTEHERVRMAETVGKHIEALLASKGLEDAIIEGVYDATKVIKDQAATKMSKAFLTAMQDESGTLNSQLFTRPDNPGTMLKNQEVVINVTTSPQKKYIKGLAINATELDKAEQRSGIMEVQVLIASNRGTLNVNGVRCAVKTLTLHARREDMATRKKWSMWRVLEYGQVSGKFTRVRARSVVAVNGEKATPWTSTLSRENGDTVSYGAWVTFMSARSKWWSSRSSTVLGNIVVESPASVYWGGSAPIRNAVAENKDKIDKRVLTEVRKGLK